MKKSLKHLPENKRHELETVVGIIRDQFPAAHLIILFGSYARGGWVEDIYTEGHITYEYRSDYDILVITRQKRTYEKHGKESAVDNIILSRSSIHTPVSVIYHSIGQVNARLREAHYFFSDIKREGIILYDSGGLKLERIKKPSPKKRKQIAEEDFKNWFKNAKAFYTGYEDAFNRRNLKLAAFLLHQATERFYTAIMLVFTGYRPKTHNIEKLGRKASSYNAEFLKVFPRATKEQDKLFKLLKRAYIDARYKPSYRITSKQLVLCNMENVRW